MAGGQEEDVLSHEEMALLDMTESMYMQQQSSAAPKGGGGAAPPPRFAGAADGGGVGDSNPPHTPSARYSPYDKSPAGQTHFQHRPPPTKGPGVGKDQGWGGGGSSAVAPPHQQQPQQQQHVHRPPPIEHQGANPPPQQHQSHAQQRPLVHQAVPAVPVPNPPAGGCGVGPSAVSGGLGGGVGALPVPVGATDSDGGAGMLPPHPTIEAFKDYQQFVTKVLDKNDVEFLGGKRVVKRGGWRKLALAFGVSFEMQSEEIVRDQHGNVVFSKFVCRAILPNGRFSDGWGACCPNEKKFAKPNHDVPATAETRAKNRACADLFGIGDAKR